MPTSEVRGYSKGRPTAQAAFDVVSERIGAVEPSDIVVGSQIGKHRWNHRIILRTPEDARSAWLDEFIEPAYQHGVA